MCEKCGYALCSCGTVYKGEREKYWYLSCTHKRKDLAAQCDGVRVKYADLLEIVRQDLNTLISLSDEDVKQMVEDVIHAEFGDINMQAKKLQKEKCETRLVTINKIITKLYTDNAEGKLVDNRLTQMVADFEREADGLNKTIAELNAVNPAEKIEQNYADFFSLAKEYSYIEELDRETLLTFVERIEVGPKVFPEGVKYQSRNHPSYRQSIRIFYKFIGELSEEPIWDLPAVSCDLIAQNS